MARPTRVSLLLALWAGTLAPVQFAAAAPDRSGPDADAAARIDRLLGEEVDGSTSAPPVDDIGFLRRAMLDIVGDLPTPEQVSAFALDPAPDKRARLVERLLADPQYGQNWARYWRDVILARRSEDRALLVANPLVVYLTEQFNAGTGWDELAREFITASGDVRQDGRTAIFAAQDGLTEESTAEISRIFLGIQIQCAQCHDHVSDRWKREQFHQLAAFFPRIAVRPLQSPTRRTLIVAADDTRATRGRKENGRRGAREHYMPDLNNPSAPGKPMTPVFFLSGKKLSSGTPDAERRGTAAEWITGDPWFATALVNRVWAELVGEGFYEPIDDMGPDRTPTAPRTIEYVSRQFVASGHDMKWLVQTIAATEAYQQQSRPRRNPNETPFAANCPQRLRADQLYNTLTRALDIPDVAQAQQPGRPGMYTDRSGPRALFAGFFGYDPSAPRDEISGSIPQALALMNAPQINRHINGRFSTTMLGRLLREIDDDEGLLVELYLRCLAREPTDSELATCLKHVAAVDERREAMEDILWVLVNSTEFLHRR